MKTPKAESEDQPHRVVSLHVHLAEAMELLECVNYYCRVAKPHFDAGSHSYRLRDLILGLRDAINESDPVYAKDMLEELEKDRFKIIAPGSHVREVHHHHYHESIRRATG